jgi:hypothetical protein
MNMDILPGEEQARAHQKLKTKQLCSYPTGGTRTVELARFKLPDVEKVSDTTYSSVSSKICIYASHSYRDSYTTMALLTITALNSSFFANVATRDKDSRTGEEQASARFAVRGTVEQFYEQ